ncbi:MAG: terminase family protein [Pseudomonadota bacterium]
METLTPETLAALPFLFDIWGRTAHQLPPAGDWSTWLIMGGRGAGKTRAGAEWVRREVEGATPLAAGRRRRIGLVAETIDQAAEVMVRGDSGLFAISPADRRPEFNVSRKVLIWPNGAEAAIYSASSPESLRGPQFDGVWADELGKWAKAQAAFDMIRMCLRLGDDPRMVVTTTPRRNKVLEGLLEDPSCRMTSAATAENLANLADGFVADVYRRYAGTRHEREELLGEFLAEAEGALWSRAGIEAARVRSGPEMRRVVVAVDPPASAGVRADECGIVVVGLGANGLAYVLADCSSQGERPEGWARRAVGAYEAHSADRIIAEVNNGGAMVESVLRSIDADVSYRAVNASRGKTARAEPVSALYEQGKVKHLGGFHALEDQMCGFGFEGGSPDRVDALVWAVTELMLTPNGRPRARTL